MNDPSRSLGFAFTTLVVVTFAILVYAIGTILDVPSMLKGTPTGQEEMFTSTTRTAQNDARADLEGARRIALYRQRISDLERQIEGFSTTHEKGSLPPPSAGEADANERSVDVRLPEASILPDILDSLEESDGAVREIAALRSAVDDLLQQLQDGNDERLLLSEVNQQLQDDVNSLSASVTLLEEISQTATREAESARSVAAGTTAAILNQLGSEAVPLLLDSLESEEESVQIWGLEVLPQLAENPQDAIAVVRSLTEDDNPRVRAAALRTLRALQRD